MGTYRPDCWVVVKIVPADVEKHGSVHYRVFAVWRGGFADGDRWKMNSGITNAAKLENFYYFGGSSGSTYICHQSGYGVTAYGAGILNGIIADMDGMATVEVLPSSTDWLSLDYNPGEVD